MIARRRDQALALSGVLQALDLVQRAARGHALDPRALTVCLGSLFQTDPRTAQDVYGDLGGLARGLSLLERQLTLRGPHRDLELTRYTVAVLHAERQLSRRPRLLKAIRAGIDHAATEGQRLPLTHPEVSAALAETYTQTVSTLPDRILITGAAAQLAMPDNIHRVRALLLAAIRSAVLWRQCGGGRLKLLFSRAALLEAVGGLGSV
ncbi:MAG: lysogenization regulator HflD [Chromatiales bacterium 21-64-14]|nr:MAG: lysogenization regulator HflD [Chromatiales bacterium 21-64-14]HQU16405.1 high frequency lysogenization protein HflD [Gammaproteobacteria bacterium]